MPGRSQEQVKQAYPIVAGELEPRREWTQFLSYHAWVVVDPVEDLPNDLRDRLRLVMVGEQIGDHSPRAGRRQAMQDEPVLVGHLSAVQRGFHEKLGAQCGYCTPGFIMASAGLLRRNPRPTDDDIREALGSNICRCTGYVKIIEAVQHAAALCATGVAP